MDPSHSQVPSVQSNSGSDQQAADNIYHPIGQSSFSGNGSNFQFVNTPVNVEQSFSSNQFQNTSQGFPVDNQWPSAPAMGYQSPMIPNLSVNQGCPGYPGHINQFIPQFPQLPYPANHPSQFMLNCDWINPDPFFMPPPPPPFPTYNPTMPFGPMSMMGYPTHPSMQFGPHQPTMPFSQIKMEPSATMDPTQGYYNMVPHNGQGWQGFYGPPQHHQASVFQESASTPNPVQHTITSHQVEESSERDSSEQSSDKLQKPNVVKIVNPSNQSTYVQNGNNSSDKLVKTKVYHQTASPKSCPLKDAPKQNNWSEKLERTRVKMSFSPNARHDIPCSSCFQHQINRSLSVKSAATPNSEDGVIIVPDHNHNVLTGHILCENCGAVNETEEMVEKSEEFSQKQLSKDFVTSLKHQLKEPFEVDVFNIGTLSQMHKVTPCKSLLSGGSSKITPGSDNTNQENIPEICSLPLSSNSKESVVIDTPDTTRRLSMKGIVSMQHKNTSDQVTPPPKKIRICWSCQTQQSKGPWHGHKFRENNFLCGECFDMHKKINARREEEAVAEATKSKEEETTIEISIETETLKKKNNARREVASDESRTSKEKEPINEVSTYNRRDISFKKKKKINDKREEVLADTMKSKETSNEVSLETETFKKKVITDHNDQDFYLSSPVKNTPKESSLSSSKVEKKSTRFTRQWAKSQLVSDRHRGISAKNRGCSKPLGEMVEDEDDDIARALREMGEGEEGGVP